MHLACSVVTNGWEVLKIVHRNLAAAIKYLSVICELEPINVLYAKSGKPFNDPGKAEGEIGLCYM